MSELTQQELTAKIVASLTTLRALVATIDATAAAEPSALPGWSRAHLLAHIDGFARAATRQLESIGATEPFPMYDGGAEGRNNAIELLALMRADALVERVDQALAALGSAVNAIKAEQWELATGFRGTGSVAELFAAIWRESVIHSSDLLRSHSPANWEPEFNAHLFTELASRVPKSKRYILQPHGAQRIALGSGDEVVVLSGTDFDLAAWLAGRQPLGPVQATAGADGADLPELGPWPSGLKARN